MKRALSYLLILVVIAFLLSACAGEYEGLDTAKGLDIYAWQTEEGVCFGLCSGAKPSLSAEEISTLKPVNADKMKEILSSYNLSADNLFLYNNTEFSNAEVCKMLGLIEE